jgi:hypothetical protein
VNLNLLAHVYARVFRVHDESWYGERVLHALLHGGGVRGVEDEVQDVRRGVVEECEGWRGGGEVVSDRGGLERRGDGGES